MKIGILEEKIAEERYEAFRKSADIGFDGVELVIEDPDAEEEPIWTESGRNRVHKNAVETGIEIPSILFGISNEGLISNDQSNRSDACDATRQAIEFAASLGASIVLVPFFGPAEIRTTEHKDNLIKSMKQLVKHANSMDVTLAIENTLSVEENSHLIDNINSSSVGIYYDVGNAVKQDRDPAEDIRKLNQRIVQVHFKDRDSTGSKVMLGTGIVDFTSVRNSLDAINYNGWVVLETAVKVNPIQSANENLEYTRRVLQNDI